MTVNNGPSGAGFVHLHTHSEYSLLEASSRLKALAKKASEYQMPALALTDNGNMFGAIEFYFACMDKNVKPIIGLDAYMAPNGRLQKGTDRNEVQRPPTRLVLLAQNLEGYKNLCKISSIGYQEGFYYKPRIDYEVLEKLSGDIICLSGGLRGEIPFAFLNDGPEVALEKVRRLKEIFGDRFYLEMNRTGVPQWNDVNPFLMEASKIAGVPLVAANDVHYLERDDQMIQEVLVCIGTNKTLQDETRYRLGSDQFYLKKPEQMRELFKDLPEACDRTLEIADRCNVKFKLKDDKGKPIYHLPSFPTRHAATVKEEMEIEAQKGLEERFQEAEARGEPVTPEQRDEYQKRLTFELGVIDRMGFNGYFLIVADFINWAKEHGIPVGPGRGSGAGSLVAYSLKITDLDPMPYKLLFERFLNPERISMPDFDIDFCQDRRQEVIQYVTEKYSQDSVSQIITYGKLQAKAAIKDVGRVLGMTYAEVDQVSKLIPDKPGTTLEGALEAEPRMNELMEMSPQVNTLVGLARRVEGLVRHAGIHAAGVIIADGSLVSHAPLYKGADGENVVQYDMKHAEKIGLIKFDFLGLKTLTHINHALHLIEKNRGKKITTKEISLSDPGIYEIMSRGDTAGIFQFEGEGITDAIRKIRPTTFFDITAINALYRPGPMAMIPDFAKRKHGEEPVTFLFDDLKDVLDETYGIIVYQEQVMGIASKIAGYSLGEADMLRRAMGKKIKEEMDQHRLRFMKGATEKGYDPKKSDELFDLMYKFADYGFNKSHAAAYCVVAAHTAYLKNYYPAEFFAALLSTELSDTDKVVKYVKDAQRRGLLVKPPHVNDSEFLFTVKGEDIYFGLGAIKGVGELAIKAIVDAREANGGKKFETLEEFFERVDLKRLNKKVIECLIKAGALDGFGAHRAQIMAGYQKFLDRAEESRKEREVGQVSLFDLGEGTEKKVVLEQVKPWSRSANLSFEKEVLGFYLSDHPLKGFENIASIWTTGNISDMPRLLEEHKAKLALDTNKQKYDFRNRDGNKRRVVVSGIVAESRELITKKGTRMAFAKLEDLTGALELVIFPDSYAKVEGLLKEEKPLLIGGFLEGEDGGAKIIVDSVALLEEALRKTRKMILRLDKLEESQYEALYSILTENKGNVPVELIVSVPELGQEVLLETEGLSGVQVGNELLESMHSQFGHTNFIEMRV
ncbi:MAG: DNA polymerase III subunit alpha [Bdellovibrionaceae bacterium]|nr:DNA polymerase III subunit alpha [Pseudobdellovibrionaceae bacterium]